MSRLARPSLGLAHAARQEATVSLVMASGRTLLGTVRDSPVIPGAYVVDPLPASAEMAFTVEPADVERVIFE